MSIGMEKHEIAKCISQFGIEKIAKWLSHLDMEETQKLQNAYLN
jgi:hypothetical protein